MAGVDLSSFTTEADSFLELVFGSSLKMTMTELEHEKLL